MRWGALLLLLVLILASLASAPAVIAHPDPEPEVPRPLVVSWTPATPRAGDTLEVRIEGLGTWPPPICLVDTVPSTLSPRIVGRSVNAADADDGYVCPIAIEEDGFFTLTILDVEAGVYRLHGPHFLATEAAAGEPMATISDFRLDTAVSPEGIVRAHAIAPPELLNVRTPDTVLLSSVDLTHARIDYMVLPDPVGFSMRVNMPAPYDLPHEIAPEIDVQDAYAHAEVEFDPATTGFALVAYATASRQNAFGLTAAYGVSDADVQIYGTCVERKCLVVDG